MVSSECQRIAKQYPHDHRNSHDSHTRHHGIAHIFPPYKSSIEECKPRRHKKYQSSTKNHKTCISCIHIFSFPFKPFYPLSMEKEKVPEANAPDTFVMLTILSLRHREVNTFCLCTKRNTKGFFSLVAVSLSWYNESNAADSYLAIQAVCPCFDQTHRKQYVKEEGFIMRYSIQGETLPVVICELEAGEKMITEKGSMSWMSPNMQMETTTNGGIGKAFGRLFSGDSMFQNIYTAKGGNGMIAFASSFPGSIKAFQITPGNDMIFQKSAFLASEAGVDLSIHFHKKFASGLFGGEGFILQRLSGQGIAFAEFDGHVVEYELAPGQQIIVDTGHLAAMSASCDMEIRTVPGVKNMLFGGEGVFNTVITGPGHVWLQTMPISNVADVLRPFFPSNNG